MDKSVSDIHLSGDGGGGKGNLHICDISLHLGLEYRGRDGCQILNSMSSVLAEVQKQ